MKRIISVMMVFVFCGSFCACGILSGGSGVTSKDIQAAIKEFDNDGILITSKNDDGGTLSYTGPIMLGEMVLTGKTDKNGNVTEITAVGSGINVSYFNTLTASQLVLDMSDVENVPMNKLAGESMLVYFSYIMETCSGEMDMDSLLEARMIPQTKNGWTYTINSNTASNTVTITAVYAAYSQK